MARRYPFFFIFLLTVLLICSGYYLRFPFDLRADTDVDYLDSLRVFRVQVMEQPVSKPNNLKLTVSLLSMYDRIADTTQLLSGEAVLYLRTDSLQSVPAIGDILLVRTRITRPQPVFAGDFDYGNYLRLQHKAGVGYVRAAEWQCVGHVPVRTLRAYAAMVQQRLVQRYRDAGLTDTALAFVSAITLGERDALDSELRRSFAAAGAAHILAVSGLHTGIIYFVLASLLTFFGLRRPLYDQRLRRVLLATTIIIAMWGYAFITGLSPSVMRAVVMLTIVQAGWMLRRTSISLNTLAATACICLWANPLSLFSVSFQLSFSAVLCILLFVPYLNGLWQIKRNKPKRLLRDMITVSIAATIGTLPITFYYFGQVSRYFLLANIILILAAYILVILGALVLLLANTVVGTWLAVALKYLSGWVCGYVSWIEHLPFATMQLSVTPWMLVCIVAAILCCYLSMQRRRLVWLAPAVALVALFCGMHVYNTRQNMSEQAFAVRGHTLYYRHAGITEQHTLHGRYTFFRFDGKDYVYAPYLTARQKRALDSYCLTHSITPVQP